MYVYVYKHVRVHYAGGAQFSPDEQEQVRRQQERQFAINQKYHRLHEKVFVCES